MWDSFFVEITELLIFVIFGFFLNEFFNLILNSLTAKMSFLLMLGHIFNVRMTRASSLFGINITCFQKGGLGKSRTYKLIDKYCKEGYCSNHLTDFTKFLCFHSHAESNARLGKQSYTQILYDFLIAF